ncbi:MAG TPA: Ig-like domain-containing protein [Candidatus Polarisedimenticolia bacterium]|nr:Ig-like domain-containing protein [Candidatus Polarisedimenticolia bacterium]
MKESCAFVRKVLLVLCALVLNHPAWAQTVVVPIVTMHVPDPIASESGDPATFEVDRQGPTNLLLTVSYNIGGTASNGVDYVMISRTVTILAGARSAMITINPLADKNVPGNKTVALQLTPSILLTPFIPGQPGSPGVSYIIGSPSNGVAHIFDDINNSNPPPVVNFVAPPDGSIFYAPTNIGLFAKTFELNGSVSNVEFFANDKDLGSGHLLVLDPPGVDGVVGPIYYLNWTGATPGKYSLSAVATGNDGTSTTSAPVSITVLPPPPVAQIASPTNGEIFKAPIDIPISATASSSNVDIVRVDFFADDHFIGTDSGTNKVEYDMVWSNTPPGFFGLRAVAVDSFGGKGSSGLVRIAVFGTHVPPPHLPVVTIRTFDPLAVVGTICLHFYSNSPVAGNILFHALTNTASFIVNRSGDTNSALTVYYSIGGTASNGLDYATLPGSVTIPTGRRAAMIVVDPLLDEVTNCPETVILSLQQETNSPPPYLVGWPDRAAAVIVGCDFMPPATRLLCDGRFHFCFPPVSTVPFYRLECSMDMVHWLPVCTNTASQLGIHFTDPQSPDFPNLFYRVVPEAHAPVDFP